MDYIMPYSEAKIRPNLKMASQRITILINKKENAQKHAKREVIQYLFLHSQTISLSDLYNDFCFYYY